MYRGLYKPKSPNGTPNTYMIGDTVLHEGKMYVALNQTQKSPLQSPRDWRFTNITEPYQNGDAPLSPEENQFWVDEDNNLYIRSFENNEFVWTLLAGSTLSCWGSFWDNGNKGITSITASYGITFGNSDPANNGISLNGGNRIVFSKTGVYNLQFSAQLMNTNTTGEQEATFWFRKNGLDISASAGIGTISKQRGTDPGYSLIAYNLILPLMANDYIEMYWHASSIDVSMHAYPAGTTPVHPVAPSIIFTAQQVTQQGGRGSNVSNSIPSFSGNIITDNPGTTAQEIIVNPYGLIFNSLPNDAQLGPTGASAYMLHLNSFYLPRDCTITRILAMAGDINGSIGNTGQFYFSIYDCNPSSGLPFNLLYVSPIQTITRTPYQRYNVPISVGISAGSYWIGYLMDRTGVTQPMSWGTCANKAFTWDVFSVGGRLFNNGTMATIRYRLSGFTLGSILTAGFTAAVPPTTISGVAASIPPMDFGCSETINSSSSPWVGISVKV